MVDALRRAHRLLRPDGCVVDLHPTAAHAIVEVGTQTIGDVDADDGPLRHAAAGDALNSVVDAGFYAVERSFEFSFYTYADTIEDLREYVEQNWLHARINDSIVRSTNQVLCATPGGRPRVREQVRLTRLRPLSVA
jgi:hypothetical protein